MATKVTILGMDDPKEKELKKIEFVKFLDREYNICPAKADPSSFNNIELVSKDNGEYDIMFVWDFNRSAGRIVLGHFNDGIV